MLKRNLLANYLGQGWTALMGLAFIPLYIRYLGIEAYGLIGLFAMLQAWLGLLDMGMTPTLNREMARFTGGAHSAESIRDLLRSIEFIAVGIAVLLGLGIWSASGWLASDWLRAEKLPIDVVAQAFTIMGLVAALRFVEGVYRSAIIGLQRQVLFNVLYSIMATLRGLGAVGILVWVSPTIKAFFIWQSAVSIAMLAILAITTYVSLPSRTRSGRFSLDALRSVWRFAGGMVLGTLSGLFLMSTDKILITKYLTLADVGYYTFAATVVSVLGVMLGPVNQAIFPRFAELMTINARTTLANTFLNASQLITVFLGSITVVLIVHSYTIIYLWSGDPDLARNSAPIATLLAVATLVASPSWMLYQAQLAYGLPSIGVKINFINILFTLPALLYCIPRYGLQGGACVMVATSVIGTCLHIYYTFGMGVMANYREWALKTVLQPILAALLVTIPTGFLGFIGGDRKMDALFLLLVFIFTFGATLSVADRIRAVLFLNSRSVLFWLGDKHV